MGFTTSNLSLYHTFSKTPVDSNTNSAAAQLGNANNKSGHTVQSNEIWTESIPFFGLAATTTAIHDKFSATAKVNDLVKDADGKIWQRNSTLPQFDASGALTSTFADLWFEKTTSITSNVKVDGAYPTTDGALVDGSYLLNSEGVPTVKYYEKRLLTRLTAENNANTNSDNKASRLQIDGKWIDQFIGATDIYLNGSAAVSYIPVLRKTEKDSPMQSGPGKGYMDYCATGLILWESSAAGTEVIDCFEYVGAKLDATVAKLSAAVFGSGSTGDEDLSLSEQVAKNKIDINLLENKVNAYHEAGVSYKVYNKTVSTDADLPDLTDKDILEDYKNVILLVPTSSRTDGGDLDESEAMSGGYIEYLCVKTGETTYAWEKIGTTEADLSGYVNKIATGQATTLANKSSVYANIATDGTLTVGVADATASGKGLVKLAANVADGSTTDVTTAAAVKAYAQKTLTVKDGRETVTENDLWCTTATLDENGNLTITHNDVINPNINNNGAWNQNITKVEDNKAYEGDKFFANIQTNMIKNGDRMFYHSQLAKFNGDLSNLENGYSMFDGTQLESFVDTCDLSNLKYGRYMFANTKKLTRFSLKEEWGTNDEGLSSLINGEEMFYQSGINYFYARLSSLVEGNSMFANTNLTDFSSQGTLTSLKNAPYMFTYTKLPSFSEQLTSLENANSMFRHCTNLLSFQSNLGHLINGGQMFYGCTGLKQFDADLSNLKDGWYMFYVTSLASFAQDLSSLTDGRCMFQESEIESFCGDLSSMTKGDKMFLQCYELKSFCGDLSSLNSASEMFKDCRIDEDSVECIADSIKQHTDGTIRKIEIGIDYPYSATNLSERLIAAFTTIHNKGWAVFVDGSTTQFAPPSGESGTNLLNETGETPVAPKPYWAKPLEVTEEEAEFVGEDGKFYQVLGGQYIFVDDPDTYGMFVSREDAIANMRLTKYEKPTEEETQAQA